MSRIRTITLNVQITLFIVVMVLFTSFLLQNLGTIQMNFLIFTVGIPTIILILVAMLIGFFGGYLFAVRLQYIKHTRSKADLTT